MKFKLQKQTSTNYDATFKNTTAPSICIIFKEHKLWKFTSCYGLTTVMVSITAKEPTNRNITGRNERFITDYRQALSALNRSRITSR